MNKLVLKKTTYLATLCVLVGLILQGKTHTPEYPLSTFSIHLSDSIFLNCPDLRTIKDPAILLKQYGDSIYLYEKCTSTFHIFDTYGRCKHHFVVKEGANYPYPYAASSFCVSEKRFYFIANALFSSYDFQGVGQAHVRYAYYDKDSTIRIYTNAFPGMEFDRERNALIVAVDVCPGKCNGIDPESLMFGLYPSDFGTPPKSSGEEGYLKAFHRFGKHDPVYKQQINLDYFFNWNWCLSLPDNHLYTGEWASPLIKVYGRNDSVITVFGQKGNFDKRVGPVAGGKSVLRDERIGNNPSEAISAEHIRCISAEYEFIYHESLRNLTFRTYQPGYADPTEKISNPRDRLDALDKVLQTKPTYLQVYDNNKANTLLADLPCSNAFHILSVSDKELIVDPGQTVEGNYLKLYKYVYSLK